MVYAIVGSNWYLVKQALDLIVGGFQKEHGDLAIERLQGSEVEYSEIVAALSSVSLFMSTKMVVVYDLSGNKGAAEHIDDLLKLASDDAQLVIVELSVDKRSSYYKQIKKLKNFKEYSELSEDALVPWARGYVKDNNGTLSMPDAQYLIRRVGANQTMLERELSKLLQYGPIITGDTINELTEQTPSGTIFNLVDMVFSGDVSGALRMYDNQRAQKVEPQAIFGMFVWQMHIVAVCLAAGSKNSMQISQETSLNNYVVSKAQAIARRMGSKKVIEFLDLLRDIELTSKKQTYNFDDAMRYAITWLAA